MKSKILLLMGLMIVSCKGQTDLENLKYDESITKIIETINDKKEDRDPTYGLLSYRIDNLNGFKYGDVSFSKFSVNQGYDDSYSEIYLHVNNYSENKFLGFSMQIAKEEEGKKLVDYLKKKYGNPDDRETGDNGTASFWNLDKNKQWIFLIQSTEKTKTKANYLNTSVVIVKQGVRVSNSTDLSVFTVLDNFNLGYPKK
jgi:hypothetical protein